MPARITWIGHASAQIEFGTEKVLIDPLGVRRCLSVEPASTILITHAHVDHLNRWTLARLPKDSDLVVPKGASHIVSDLGFRSVREVEPGDQIHLGSIDVACVPTKHDPGRWRKGDGPTCSGYVLSDGKSYVHHSGDVDMSEYDLFEDIGRQFPIDATLLPIGGMLPVWYYRMRRNSLDQGVHIDPDTALEIAVRLGAKTMIPVHWGTVNLRLGPPSAPRRRLEKVADESNRSNLIEVLKHGASLTI